MNKVINFILWIGNIFFFLTIVVLAALYLRWFQLTPPVFEYGIYRTNGFPTEASIFGLILLALYGFFALMLKLTKKNKYVNVFLFFPTLLFLCINSLYLSYFMPYLRGTAECNGIIYYITSNNANHLSIDWDYDQLTKWNRSFKYDSFFFGYSSASSPNEIICDEKANEVNVFSSSNHLMYHDGSQSYRYDWLHTVSTTDHTYELYSYDVDGIRRYVITECRDEAALTCQIYPIDHSSPSAQDEKGSLIVDAKTKQIYILFDGRIDSAHGRNYQKFSQLASVKTGTYIGRRTEYSIAAYSQNDIYTYIFYMCDITNKYNQYTECYYIPFSYSTPDQKSTNLAISKGIDKLSVFIDDKLIFTYDYIYNPKCYEGCSDSQCHIDSCTIPKP